jgi:signal peptidase II
MKKYGVMLYSLIAMALLVAIDQITKYVILFFAHAQPVVVIDKFLRFEIAYNRGISWGLFDSESTSVFAFITGCIIVVTAIIAYQGYLRLKQGLWALPELLIVAGSIGNLIDRFVQGGVIDFILCTYGSCSFPVFNVADVFVVCGVALFAYRIATE